MFVEFTEPNGDKISINCDKVLWCKSIPTEIGTVQLVLQVIPVATAMGRVNFQNIAVMVKGTFETVQAALNGKPVIEMVH